MSGGSGDFSDKVVLITGASSGIGAAIAVEMARHGARLALTGRNGDNLQRVADDCWRHLSALNRTDVEQPLTILADLARQDDVRTIVERTVKRFRRLDVLVNNAAAAELASLEHGCLEQFDHIMAVNVRAVYQLTTLSAPHLAETKGSIVNISSIAGSHVVPGMLAYSVSKAALDQLTRCSALELAPRGIRVNAIIPGTVRSTRMLQRQGFSDEAVDGHMEKMKDLHPLGRVGEPDDVVRAVVFLASEKASFITGDSLYVDGGVHLSMNG